MGRMNQMVILRASTEQRIIDALAHLEREHAMSIIMSFIPIKELKEIADFQEREN